MACQWLGNRPKAFDVHGVMYPRRSSVFSSAMAEEIKEHDLQLLSHAPRSLLQALIMLSVAVNCKSTFHGSLQLLSVTEVLSIIAHA